MRYGPCTGTEDEKVFTYLFGGLFIALLGMALAFALHPILALLFPAGIGCIYRAIWLIGADQRGW